MLAVLHEHGWSTLFHADNASAQFSFDYQPKQQTFNLPFGLKSCTAQSDGGICLTDDITAAVELAHPVAVVECKRNRSPVSDEALFSQVVAEMMFAIVLNGLRLSFLRADFPHEYLDTLSSGEPFPLSFHWLGVSEMAGANLAERRGRSNAIDGFLRLMYTLRTRYTTSLMRAYFDTADRMVGLEDLYY